MEALQLAASLGLNDWCLSAGFLRNLVWDHMHGYKMTTPLHDIDLIYFNPDDVSAQSDKAFESRLKQRSAHPWSVKNQARMHLRNGDHPYTSTEHAMRFWVEIETAVGVRLEPDKQIRLLAPFGLEALFNNSITLNSLRPKPEAFRARIEAKQWLKRWPLLKVTDI